MITTVSRPLPRALLVLSALAAAGLAAPLPAAPRAGSYAVTLAAPLAQARQEIINGTVWTCEDTRCSARADGARALVVCQAVARKFGPVARFATPRADLSADDLARCNGG